MIALEKEAEILRRENVIQLACDSSLASYGLRDLMRAQYGRTFVDRVLRSQFVEFGWVLPAVLGKTKVADKVWHRCDARH